MIDPTLLLLLACIVFAAFIAKGATGFGESLLIIPILLLFLDPKFVLPVVLITTSGADVYLLRHHHRDVHRPGLVAVIMASVIGVVGGTLLFHQLQSGLLKTAFALFVMLFALRMLFFQRAPGPVRAPHIGWGLLTGLTAGFIDAIFGTGGPPLIIYLTWLGLSKSPFRATFVILALFLHIARLIAYGATGLFTPQILLTGLCLILPMIAGTLLGRKLHHRLNEHLFQRIAAVVLIIISVKLLF